MMFFVAHLSFWCPFLGSVFLVYESKGGNTLNGFEVAGCGLIAAGFLLLTLLLIALLGKADA